MNVDNINFFDFSKDGNIGCSWRVYFLTTLDMPCISNTNLNSLERRAGAVVENVAGKSANQAAELAYQAEIIICKKII